MAYIGNFDKFKFPSTLNNKKSILKIRKNNKRDVYINSNTNKWKTFSLIVFEKDNKESRYSRYHNNKY